MPSSWGGGHPPRIANAEKLRQVCAWCLRKRKKKKKTYVSNTVCKGESRMKNTEKYWENWVGDRSPGAQKAVIRKLYFIPSRVVSHWRIFKQGRGIKFTIYLFLQFYFFASMDKYVLTFFSDTRFGETLSFETSFPTGWGLAFPKTEKSSDAFRCCN